jgi:hypothetical protein
VFGSIPAASTFTAPHENATSTTKPQHIKTLERPSAQVFPHQSNTSEHQDDTFLHDKCVICVSHIPDDLATVVRAWDSLPAAVKAGIVAMVNASRPQ